MSNFYFMICLLIALIVLDFVFKDNTEKKEQSFFMFLVVWNLAYFIYYFFFVKHSFGYLVGYIENLFLIVIFYQFLKELPVIIKNRVKEHFNGSN